MSGSLTVGDTHDTISSIQMIVDSQNCEEAYWSPATSCENTNDGATNTYFNDCAAYDAEPAYCDEPDKYDDDDFTATTFCCSCGGGATSISVTHVINESGT